MHILWQARKGSVEARPPVSSAIENGGCYRSSTRKSSSACSPTCLTRPSFSVRTAFARCRAITWNIRLCFMSVVRSTRSSTCPANPTPACSAATPTGPVWMPVNVLIVRALLNLYTFYGDEFKVQCPTGSGRFMTLFEVAQELVRRLTGSFLRDAKGQRPIYGGTAKFQDDPHWRDLILFHEYFHGDNGAGLGASHQTGWTGLVAPLLDLFGRVDAKTVLETERERVFARVVTEQVGGE